MMSEKSEQSWEFGGTSHILPRERERATFDVKEMTHFLDGGEKETARRRWIQNASKNHELQGMHTMSRDELTAKSVKHFVDIHMEHIERGFMLKGSDGQHMTGSALLSGPLMPHYSLFIMTIAGQASPEQVSTWLPKAYSLKIIGAYAQTELGHGSNVRGLQTTAEYDAKTGEFVLNTPTLQSMKWWNSNAGLFATHCALYAQLVINGQDKGVHVFMLQLRDENHQLLPGIECGDVGTKLGDNAIDTGYIRLKNVRIPRQHLMSRRQHVEKDGTYVKHSSGENKNKKDTAKSDKMHYLTMMGARVGMVAGAADALAIAATIAIRYSAVRHQGFKGTGSFKGEEYAIIDYRFQQYRLFSNLSYMYAFKVVGNWIRERMGDLLQHIDDAGDDIPEVHASAAGLKGLCTKQAHDGIEDLRKCCGGHGFLMNTGIAALSVDYVWKVTAEGDWVVMLLQTARFLMKQIKVAQNFKGPVSELNLPGLCEVYQNLSDPTFDAFTDGRPTPEPTSPGEFGNLSYLLSLFRYRVLVSSVETEAALQTETERLKSIEEAWNSCAVQLVQTAISHCEYFILDKFISYIGKCKDEYCRESLASLCQMYALSRISLGHQWEGILNRHALKLMNSCLNSVLDQVRINAVPLVDALDFPDHVLNSTIGRYDGNVYEALFEEARNSPLNTHLRDDKATLRGYEFVRDYLDKDFLSLRNGVPVELRADTARI
mmetsp:Transcript_24293/g.29642  ORF Transcript_24293/g.29642 Transcript_24293/m.29642 type:complete len:715 (-) Transcript_24293:258-2402(-)|eukprot:CAMPEP_0204839342 /NCGR_PEP_ID=MMETSP1346-20131115/33869_1 /ASSEMBLY_ACC=CAM_ASM_000771 /TAXON_ID=215587 /ORGANISM="Aplanochytrium stocchinoi, Strain GSBS06" /LENGTH=714 /DNA_ID=CAMNT_0051975979 /DNA_START=99 /DNA_END=2243 /DNA_ORIENTATION=-